MTTDVAQVSKTDYITNTLMTTFINSSNGFVKQLTTVLLMSSIDEIKKIIGDLFTYIRSNYSNIFSLLNPKSIVKFIYQCIYSSIVHVPKKYIMKSKEHKDDDKLICNDSSKLGDAITIQINNSFLNNLVQYTSIPENNSSITYDPKVYSVNIIDRTNIVKNIRIIRFDINYENMTLISTNSFNISVDSSNHIVDYTLGKSSEKNWSFIDFIPKGSSVHKYIQHYIDKYNDIYESSSTGLHNLSVADNKFITVPHNSERNKGLIHRLWNNVITNDKEYLVREYFKYYFEFVIFLSYTQNRPCLVMTKMLKILEQGGRIMCPNGKAYSFGGSKVDSEGEWSYNEFKNNILFPPEILDMVDKDEYVAIVDKIFIANDVAVIDPQNSLTFTIKNFTQSAFTDFIKHINNLSQPLGKKIRVSEVYYETIVVDNVIPNPNFKRLTKELKAQIANLPEDKKHLLESLTEELNSIPETITESINKRQRTVKFIAEKIKHFNTLYLRQDNYEELQHLLNMYKTNRSKLETYGLPDKLGVFLHGLPGTGKSSTILAIASDLRKDIFYVDLKTIKTNVELTDVFNYVNDMSSNGGIIVIEDIDVTTDVVLDRAITIDQRSSSGTENNHSNSENDSLTLSHILNLLQGTISKDGTIFIITTNHKKHLDPAIFREGRFDIDIEMNNADHYQCNQIYRTFIGRDISKEALEMLPEFKFTPAKFIFYLSRKMWKSNINDIELVNDFIKTI